jgi:hypothetical protein
MAMKATGFICLELHRQRSKAINHGGGPWPFFDESNVPNRPPGTSFLKDYIVSARPKRYYNIQMIRVFFFIFRPAAEWDAVLQANRGLGFILGIHLLPMMLLASIAEGAGLAGWWKWHSGIHGVKYFTVGEAMVWEMMQLMLMLVVIAVCAYLIRLMGETFNSHYPYRSALMVVIYSLSPLFLFRLLGAIPRISLWIPWGIGIFFSLKILYSGLPRILQSHLSHALGLFFISSLFVVVLTGAEQLIFIRSLKGQGVPIENLVLDIAAKLPF